MEIYLLPFRVHGDSAMGVQFKDRGYWFLTSPGLVYLFLIELCNNLLLCLGHIFAAAYFF